MIIVSQDKTEIINFDNVNTLRATKTGLIVSYENTYKAEDDYSNILGNYETEEKAKEVLQEIIKVYKFYNGKIYYVEDRNNLLGDYEKGVYEMPKE